MKKYFFAFILGVLFFSNTHSQTVTGAKKNDTGKLNSKPVISDFAGVWKGEEKCKNASAPVAVIMIALSDNSNVVITGMYSTKGKISGTIKNNIITITRQEIHDPAFTNFIIEGTLTISKNRKSLDGIIVVINNNMRDDCSVSYRR